MHSYYSKHDMIRSSSLSTGGKKKVKHFSFSFIDRIGKGFSSTVYKGTNDQTSTHFACKFPVKWIYFSFSIQIL